MYKSNETKCNTVKNYNYFDTLLVCDTKLYQKFRAESLWLNVQREYKILKKLLLEILMKITKFVFHCLKQYVHIKLLTIKVFFF